MWSQLSHILFCSEFGLLALSLNEAIELVLARKACGSFDSVRDLTPFTLFKLSLCDLANTYVLSLLFKFEATK